MTTTDTTPHASGWRSYVYLGMLIVGYVGVYLRRENFSVANPMLQESLGVTKAQVGLIASMSTLAYAFGRLLDQGGYGLGFAALAVLMFVSAGICWALPPVLATEGDRTAPENPDFQNPTT